MLKYNIRSLQDFGDIISTHRFSNFSEPQIAGRLMVSDMLALNDAITNQLFKNANNKYYLKPFYWSTSYSNTYVAAAISRQKIGIDIEYNQPRTPEVINTFTDKEWSLFSGEKSWTNFYLLWTAKEACLKASNLPLEEITHLKAVDFTASTLTLEYKKQKFKSQVFQKNSIVGAVCTL